jgi:electron transfer flavoprotein beta subunit
VGYDCVVLVKQVPDTKRITGKVMNDDGTVNRAALPAIFNPEDLNALELALQIKDRFGGTVTAVTMGLPAAANTLREALFRGADRVLLMTDAKAAASDTLATSYILSCAVRKLHPDIVLCGRQAIDGDTAQVGPQLAEKLGLPQVTYVEKLEGLDGRTLTLRRSIGSGWQVVRAPIPVLLTVVESANAPRVPAAKRMMKHKNAKAPVEIEKQLRTENPQLNEGQIKKRLDQEVRQLEQRGSLIQQWDLAAVDADLAWCGRSGSPTKVHRIQSVVLAAKESKVVEPNDEGIAGMIGELIEDKIIA